MATESFVRVPPDGAGKKINTISHLIGNNQVETQVIHLADPINPVNIQFVDNKGAARITFAEGPPGLTNMGNLRVAESQLMSAYMHTDGDLNAYFYEFKEDDADGIHDANLSVYRMSTSTSANSYIQRATHHYHKYQAGTGVLIMMTMSFADNGVANNVKQWGYYDDTDGIFFRLNGTDLQVGIRHSEGDTTVIDEVINHDDWNGDKLDGSGLSGMTIDLTKSNFFWMDFTFLGVANVRFGVLGEDGQRIVCHTWQNINIHTGKPYMRFASLPLQYETWNEDVTNVGSEMIIIGAAIYAEQNIDVKLRHFADLSRTVPITVTNERPIFSVRPNVYYHGTQVWNLDETFIKKIYVRTDADIKLTGYYYVPSLTGATWTLSGISSLSADETATARQGGIAIDSWILSSGCYNIDVLSLFDLTGLGIHTDYDNNQPIWTLVAKPYGSSATIDVGISYAERL